MSRIVPSGDAIREERAATQEDSAQRWEAEARLMREAALLAYGALKAISMAAAMATNTTGAQEVCRRLESVLFPPEAEDERAPEPTVADALAATQKNAEQARAFKTAFEGHFRPGAQE